MVRAPKLYGRFEGTRCENAKKLYKFGYMDEMVGFSPFACPKANASAIANDLGIEY